MIEWTIPHISGIVPGMEKTATISPCGKYRYSLGRKWAEGPHALFVMLNPSTADASKDDATVRRCIKFAMNWELCGLRVVNLFAFRATKPADMKKAEDPVGPENNQFLIKEAGAAEKIVFAWGAQGGYRKRDLAVRKLLKLHETWYFTLLKGNQPQHPLFVRGDCELKRWELP